MCGQASWRWKTEGHPPYNKCGYIPTGLCSGIHLSKKLHMHLWGGSEEFVMDGEAWSAVIRGVAKSWIRLSDWTELNWTEDKSGVKKETGQLAKCKQRLGRTVLCKWFKSPLHHAPHSGCPRSWLYIFALFLSSVNKLFLYVLSPHIMLCL